jgi:hypothetical protein
MPNIHFSGVVFRAEKAEFRFINLIINDIS